MILSWKHKFIFIKGRKVGGTSIEIALSTLCGSDDIVTPITPIDEKKRMAMGGKCQNYSDSKTIEREYLENIELKPNDQLTEIKIPKCNYYNHMSLEEVVKLAECDLNDFFIFCAERSPYSKVISWANMALTFKYYKMGLDKIATKNEISLIIDKSLKNGTLKKIINIDLYKYSSKIMTHVVYNEKLEDDFLRIIEKLKINPNISLPYAKKGISANDINPSTILKNDQILKINELFKEEFETFGYKTINPKGTKI